jgi:RNA polymerase sigma-70 factor, ECF subfamily
MSVPALYREAPQPLAALFADAEAFRGWYDLVLPRVYRYLLARCGGDAALAEELTQQTFVAAVRSHAGFDGRADVVSWLCAIARNRLVDHYRRAGRDTRRQAQLIADHRDADQAAWTGEEHRSAVRAALDELPPDQRNSLIFRYLDGLSVGQVAAALGRSVSATESLLGRAREAFRRAYGGQPDD